MLLLSIKVVHMIVGSISYFDFCVTRVFREWSLNTEGWGREETYGGGAPKKWDASKGGA